MGVANADEIVTVPTTLFDEKIAALSQAKIEALDDALRFALGLG